MKYTFAIVYLTFCTSSIAQVINTATMDTADYKLKGKFTIEAYLDVYYAYNFNELVTKDQPYLVSMARHNEININLAFIDVKYSSSRVRARIAPGFGTYINANYASEQGTLKHFVEANAGFKLTRHKNIWIDAGVLGSPYTNESAISKDHSTYTRSLSAENVPYYLSGAKITVPISKKVDTYFYLINGWQQITDQNSNKSIGTQVECRPNENTLLNWNTYVGNEHSAIDSVRGLRTFTDVYLVYSKNRWSLTSCIYGGRQVSGEQTRNWWQANIIGRCVLNPIVSIAGRIEYFRDDEGVIIVPISTGTRFRTFGTSIGVNVTPDSNLLFRTEVRHFKSADDVFQRKGKQVDTSTAITFGACVWF